MAELNSMTRPFDIRKKISHLTVYDLNSIQSKFSKENQPGGVPLDETQAGKKMSQTIAPVDATVPTSRRNSTVPFGLTIYFVTWL